MKKKLQFLSIILFSSLIFGCSSDDNSVSYTNFISYDNDTKELVKGYTTVEPYYVELALFSEGIDLIPTGGMQGAGAMIFLDFATNSEDRLGVGTYTFDDNLDVFAYQPSVYYNNTIGTSFVQLYCLDGTVEVIESEPDWVKLTFDIIAPDGKHITGSWEGDLIVL